MPHNLSLLGVDIGSVSISLVEIEGGRPRARRVYGLHRGQPERCLKALLENFDLSAIGGVALTSSTPSFLVSDHRYDDRICIMKACEHIHGRVGSILIVGGEKFGLIRFDRDGNYQGYRANTSCAAGTGSFLDQQARRLGLDGIRELSTLACSNRGAIPAIASRCAVFAKTDLVHAQQEGYTLEEICDGLCCGLAKNVANTLFSGPGALTPIVFMGGVSLNKAVVRLTEGKSLTGAEFCAPVAALHGHVKYLIENREESNAEHFLFLPVYLERHTEPSGARRQYCYYSQYASPLVEDLAQRMGMPPTRILTPLIHYLYHSFHTKAQLYRMLARISKGQIGFLEVSSAFDRALEFQAQCSRELKRLYERKTIADSGFHVVLLGRPYTVLSDPLNKGIPGIFASLGIKAFFQDMLEVSEENTLPICSLMDDFQWYFAREILKAACTVARTRSAYPVLITSFKCTPDSFLVEYFKEIMASHRKPYLVLQLDEHGSTVGYETRIEAAVEAFQNHFRSKERETRTSPAYGFNVSYASRSDLKDRTLLLPCWDNLTFPLVAAALRREGFDARLLQWTSTTVARSLQRNNGQCTPLSIIAQEFIDYVRAYRLDPARAVLWLVESNIACNICMFPRHIQTLLRSAGSGFEQSRVYVGTLSFGDLSIRLPINVYFAYLFGGLLRTLACRTRPYEIRSGATDAAVEAGIRILEKAFLGQMPREHAVNEVVSLFDSIETCFSPKPKVAIFGDLYVRDNDSINQNLIRFIERNGGEVVTMPYSAYVRMVSRPYLRKWIIEGDLLGALSSKAVLAMVGRMERAYLKHFRRLLDDSETEFTDPPEEILSRYKVRVEHTGESMEHLLKVHYLKKHYPDISLFVQTSPAFCCPSLVTEAMAEQIERTTGVPVVSVTYDGTGGNKNEAIIPYLKFPRRAHSDRLVQIV